MTEHKSTRGHDGPNDSHNHGASSTSNRKLAAVSVINLLGFFAELAGGLLFGSVALISDAFHMLFDSLAYVMAFVAAYVAENHGEGDRWSYGLHRLEPFAAFLNGLLLLPMVGFILWESYQRFLDPVDIGVGPTIAIAFGGLLVNVGSVYVLQGGDMSLNERGAFYHLLGDAGGSVAVIVSTLLIAVTGLQFIDPIVAGLIAVIIIWSAGKVLRGSSAIFLQRTPFDQEDVRTTLLEIDGVTTVDDLHAWQICSQVTVATTYLCTDVETIDDAKTLTRQVHEALADKGVNHATVELNFGSENHDSRLQAHSH